VPIRQGDGSRMAGTDLLHIKVINNIMLSKLNYNWSLFFSLSRQNVIKPLEINPWTHLSKNLVYSSFTLCDLKESRSFAQ